MGGPENAVGAVPASGAMNSARAALILATFLGGIVAGVTIYAVTDKGADANPYASLPRAAEPAVTADVARALSTDDAKGLSNQLDMEVLQQLQTAPTEALPQSRQRRAAAERRMDGVGTERQERRQLSRRKGLVVA